MKKLVILALLFSVALNANLKVEITLSKQVFTHGDTASFNYSISSDNFTLASFYPTIICDDLPKTTYELKKEAVTPIKPFNSTFKGLKVDKFPPTKNCKAIVEIVSPNRQSFSKTFEINTTPILPYILKTCPDSSCLVEKKVFTSNESIFLKAQFENNSTSRFFIENPNGLVIETEENPFQLQEKTIGTYKVKAVLNARGFRESVQETQFAVIQGEPIFQNAENATITAQNPGAQKTGDENNLLNFLLLINEFVLAWLAGIYLLSKILKEENIAAKTFAGFENAFYAVVDKLGGTEGFIFKKYCQPLEERSLPPILVTLAITSSILLIISLAMQVT